MAASESTVFQVERGFKVEKIIKFTKNGNLVLSTGPDILTVCNCGTSDTSFTQYPLTENFPRVTKYTIPVIVTKLVFAKQLKLYVAFCNDFRLRIYNLYFDLLTTLFVHFIATCICYNEVTNEVFAGGAGFIHCWILQADTFNAIQTSLPLNISFQEKELIVSLTLCHHSPLLCATCTEGVYIVDTETRNQLYYVPNDSSVPLSCVAIYSPAELLAIGREDGSLKIICYMRGIEGRTNRSLMLLKNTYQRLTSLFIHTDYPYLFATYPDGVLLVWNLGAEIQALYHISSSTVSIPLHKYNLQSSIMSAALTPDNYVMCYSQWSCTFLQLQQVEDLLTTLYSPIKTMSVKHYKDKQRYIVQTYHGFAKIISPHSGNARTVLYPLTVPRMLRAAFHNMAEEVFYVALKTGEIVVYNTRLNPCIPCESWVPSNNQQEVTCIDMVDDSVVGPLLFAGLRSGCLTILYAKDCLIGQPCPAHDGPILMMASSETDQLINKNPVINLVSYGTDGLMQGWAVEIKLDTKKQLVLHNVTSLRLLFQPLHMKILNNRLCLATIKHQVLIYKLPHSDSFQLAKPKPLPHDSSHNHTKVITSLSRCIPLSLFATSSFDGYIKIWNDSSQLVSNINIGMNVTCVCFDDLSLCLLAGFQNHLQIIPPNRYLPQRLVESHQVIETKVEYSIPYKQNTDLWYDCQKIPTLPLLPHARLHAADYIATPNPFTLRLISQPQYDSKILADGLKSIREMGIIDPDEIQNIKHQLSLKEIKTSDSLESTFMRNYSDFDMTDSLKRMEEEDMSLGPVKEQSHYQLFPEAELMPLERTSSSSFPIAPDGYVPNSVIRGKVDHQSVDHVLQRILIKQYKLLEKDSHAVAKRRRIKRVLIDLKLMNEAGMFLDPNEIYKNKEDKEEGEEEESESEEETEESSEEDTSSSDTSSEESDYYGDLFGDNWVHSTSLRLHSDSDEDYDGVGGGKYDLGDLEQKKRKPTFMFDISLGEEKEEDEETSTSLAAKRKGRPQSTEAKKVVIGSNSSSHLFHKSSKTGLHGQTKKRVVNLKVPYNTAKIVPTPITFHRSGSRASLTETQSEVLYRSLSSMSETGYRNTISTPNVAKRMYYQRQEENADYLGGDNETETTRLRYRKSMEDLMATLTNVIKSAWFPSSTLFPEGLTMDNIVSSIGRLSSPTTTTVGHIMDSEMTLDWVIDTLVNLFDEDKMEDVSMTEGIAEALAALSNNRYISTAQRNATMRAMLKKSKDVNTPESVKHHTIDLLSQLESNNETLMMILPSLVSNDATMRNAAFAALNRLTGVTDRAGLHNLLIERGLVQHVAMNEDEILKDLAQRIKVAEEVPTLSILKQDHQKQKPKSPSARLTYGSLIEERSTLPAAAAKRKSLHQQEINNKEEGEGEGGDEESKNLSKYYPATEGGFGDRISNNKRQGKSIRGYLRKGGHKGSTAKGKKRIYLHANSDKLVSLKDKESHSMKSETHRSLSGKLKRYPKGGSSKGGVEEKRVLFESEWSSYTSIRIREDVYSEESAGLYISPIKTDDGNNDAICTETDNVNFIDLLERDRGLSSDDNHMIAGHMKASLGHVKTDKGHMTTFKGIKHSEGNTHHVHIKPFTDRHRVETIGGNKAMSRGSHMTNIHDHMIKESGDGSPSFLQNTSFEADHMTDHMTNYMAALNLKELGFLDAKNLKYLPQDMQPLSLFDTTVPHGFYNLPVSDHKGHVTGHTTGYVNDHMINHMTGHMTGHMKTGRITDHMTDHMTGHMTGHITDHLTDHITGRIMDHVIGHKMTDHMTDHMTGRITDHLTGHMTGHRMTDHMTGHKMTDHMTDHMTGRTTDHLTGHMTDHMISQHLNEYSHDGEYTPSFLDSSNHQITFSLPPVHHRHRSIKKRDWKTLIRRSDPYYSLSLSARKEILGVCSNEEEDVQQLIGRRRRRRRGKEIKRDRFHGSVGKWSEFEWCDIAAMLLSK